MELNRENVDALNNKGLIVYNQGKYEEALNCFNRVIEIAPYSIYGWTNKGLILYNQEKYEEAITCFAKALDIEPRYRPSWNNLGKLFI